MTADLAAKSIHAAIRDPQMMDAALALYENRLHDAEPVLKTRLKENPFDVAAMRMLAELAGRIGRYPDAENLLRRAVELAPTFTPARSNLALVLYRQGRVGDAICELDMLLDNDPEDWGAANLKAAAASRVGDYNDAVALYEAVLKAHPAQEKIWMSFGHVLKTVGRRGDSVAAYRRALALKPEYGEVWWSLANLKTVKFDDVDIALMHAGLANDSILDEDRFHIDFALGKAYEDTGRWPEAFAHYEAGNRLRRAQLDYSAADNRNMVAARAAIMTPAFFAEHIGGCAASDPIFILGMPRAGSTLIEQILASHSMVEGTQELPDIGMMAQRIIGKNYENTEHEFPAALGALTPEDCIRLGEEYLDRTRIHRKTDKPFFIDKMPNNWLHIGLIHLILPNAKIIDARRHPMDCCFSNFKQHFARGQSFSYDLEDLGQYYRDYVTLMQAVDIALPMRVHRVWHEALVDDTEREIRKLLAYLDLPFDESCLRFFENDRAVQTPSAEQVRRPINKDGMDKWQNFDPWLGPLKSALGDVLIAYPNVPAHIRA